MAIVGSSVDETHTTMHSRGQTRSIQNPRLLIGWGGGGGGCRYWFGWRAQVRWQVIPSHRLQLCFVILLFFFLRLFFFCAVSPTQDLEPVQSTSRWASEASARQIGHVRLVCNIQGCLPLPISTSQTSKAKQKKAQRNLPLTICPHT